MGYDQTLEDIGEKSTFRHTRESQRYLAQGVQEQGSQAKAIRHALRQVYGEKVSGRDFSGEYSVDISVGPDGEADIDVDGPVASNELETVFSELYPDMEKVESIVEELNSD